MMRTGWLMDDLSSVRRRGTHPGGVPRRSTRRHRHHRLPTRSGRRVTATLYVIQNCVKYDTPRVSTRIEGRPVVKYWHDVGPWMQPDVRGLARPARNPDLLLTDPSAVHGPRSRTACRQRSNLGRSSSHPNQRGIQMRILITGISGFIGQALASQLLTDGHEVHGLYEHDTSRAKNPGVQHQHVVNLTDHEQVEEVIKTVHPRRCCIWRHAARWRCRFATTSRSQRSTTSPS
jgi:hypothetical protein